MQKPPGNNPQRLVWSRRPISLLTLAGERDWEPNKSRLREPEPPLLYIRTSDRIKTTAALMAL
jgi:hypothetical protein